MKVSIILPCFERASLLDLGLASISLQKCSVPFEVVVVNDGIHDDTDRIVEKWKPSIDIKYLFTGQRNTGGKKWRCPGFAINAGVKNCSGEIIILSCPEIYHLNDCIELTVSPILKTDRYMTTPEFMYFDDTGMMTTSLTQQHAGLREILASLTCGVVGTEAVQMPYFLGMWKTQFEAIRGYDEDFTGYACDDNDLVSRLVKNKCGYIRTGARIVHLYHGRRCDAQMHPENPAWRKNYELFRTRRGQIIRNIGREWGKG